MVLLDSRQKARDGARGAVCGFGRAASGRLNASTARQIFSAPREARTQQFLQRIIEAGRL